MGRVAGEMAKNYKKEVFLTDVSEILPNKGLFA
jgi:hypothetical protein